MNENLVPVELSDATTLGPDEKPGAIVLVDKASQLTVLSLCTQNGVKHVVQKSNLNQNGEIQLSSLTEQAPSLFFDFPLSSIFGVESPGIETESNLSQVSHRLGHISEKNQVLAQFKAYISSLTSSTSLISDTISMLDEALTNAVYSAPYAHEGANKIKINRDFLQVDIDPLKKPVLFAGHDSDRIVIGCRDEYGSLNATELILRIKRCYENDLSDMINFGDGGAGIGSFLVFNSCASMYIGVDSGQSTTVCCSFPIRMSATRRSEIPKNIHLIHR